MKKIYLSLLFVLSLVFVSVSVNAEDNIEAQLNENEVVEVTLPKNEDKVVEKQTINDKKNTVDEKIKPQPKAQPKVSEYIQESEINGSFIGLKANGKVYVKGNNNYGQLGLGNYNNVGKITELSFIKDKISKFEFNGYTLKLIVNSGKYYITGKDAHRFSIPTYKMNLNNVFGNAKTNIFVNVQGNKRTTYYNKELTKVSFIAVKSGQKYTLANYYTNGKLATNYVVNYSKNIPTKIVTTKYNSAGKWSNSLETQAANSKRKKEITRKMVKGKQKVTLEVFYNNSTNIKNKRIEYTYGNKANYVSTKKTFKYNSKGKKASYLKEVFNNKKKRTYRYYETNDVTTNKIKGVTRTWYKANGRVKKKDITIKNIKYYSQHDRRWAGTRCYKKPYNIDINNTGCMLSSFAMINSKYSKALNPGQIKAKGLDCYFDYNKAAKIFGYNVQNTWSKQGFTRNVNTKFSNSKKLVPNGKSTYTIKEALEKHIPVQLWMAHKYGSEHMGHSIVAYKYVYQNGYWDIKFYDPWTPNTPSRSLKDLSSRWWLTKAQIWQKK